MARVTKLEKQRLAEAVKTVSAEKKHLRKNVERILKDYEEARNCDKFLVWTYWITVDKVMYDYGRGESLSFHGYMGATPSESITRTRRLIQGDERRNLMDRYLPTRPEVRRARRICEVDWSLYCIMIKQGYLDI